MLAFDAFVENVDRSWRNPNLLIWHGALWMIDHGATLYFHHDWARAAAAVLALRDLAGRGYSIIVFPEGTRSRDGKLLRFKKGGFLLAAQSNRPIVPVTINGSRQVLPAGAWRLRRGIVEVIIGEPIAVDGFGPGTLRHLSNQVRQAIEKTLRSEPVDLGPAAANSSHGIITGRDLEKRSI